MLKKINKSYGQSLIEFSLVAGFVILAIMAMNPMIKRMSQSMTKTVADQIGVQQNAEQGTYTDIDRGYLVGTNIVVDSQIDKFTDDVNGTIIYTYDDQIRTNRIAETNLGFTPN